MTTIKFDLSTKGIDKAIKELQRYRRKTIENGMRNAAELIARALEDTAQKLYGKSVTVTKQEIAGEKSKYRFEVIASGKGVCFIEFGAGAFADSQHPYTTEVTIPVFPGSYSETVGAGTYTAYVAVHGTDEGYPFNRQPRRAFYNAVLEVKQQLAELTRKAMMQSGGSNGN